METPIYQQVDPAIIVRPPQTRKIFSAESIAEMADSIREVGIESPILVYQELQDLVLLDGERRLRAALLLGMKLVPILIKDKPQENAGIVQRQMILNSQREDLNPIEQATGIALIMKEANCTASDAARKIGKSPSYVSKVTSLLTLSAETQEKIGAGQITVREGYRLARERETDTSITVPAGKKPRRPKLTAVLDPLRSVVVEGIDSTMDAFIETLEAALARSKTARRQKLELPTFLAALRDQAKI